MASTCRATCSSGLGSFVTSKNSCATGSLAARSSFLCTPAPGLSPLGGQKAVYQKSCRSSPVRALTSQEVDIEKVQPIGDRLFVRVDDAPQATAGGVLLPKSSTVGEKFLLGEVLAVGKDASETYTKGQRVLFTDLHTQEVNLGAKKDKLAFVKAKDLLGVVE